MYKIPYLHFWNIFQLTTGKNIDPMLLIFSNTCLPVAPSTNWLVTIPSQYVQEQNK